MFRIPVETKPALWGAFAGALVLAIVGFTWGGWLTPKMAREQAGQQTKDAVVAALAPICAAKFRQNANATANLAEMNKLDSWQHGNFVKNGGWATFAGNEQPDTNVADACAKLLGTPQKS